MKKILLVDDEKDLIEMPAFRLKSNNYEVISSYDGADAYITKPFEPGTLLSKIKELLKEP